MGKGGRCPETRAGRYARCETPKPSWGSSARGGTLESWVLRKAHARFGEGRMEKCSRSNSPAAYSTCLCDGGQSGAITRPNLAEINRSIREGSCRYFFALDLTQCP